MNGFDDDIDIFKFYLDKKFPKSVDSFEEIDDIDQSGYDELKEIIGILKTKGQRLKNYYLKHFYEVVMKVSYKL